MQTASKKVINSWAMYDWANSVYSLVICSTIFPAFYEAVTGDGNEATLIDKVTIGSFQFINTALYNYVLAIAFILVAILSPILSSIADFKGNKKQFLRFFCSMGSLACCSLYFFDAAHIGLGLISMIIVSTSTTAASALLAAVTMLRVYCSWPGVSPMMNLRAGVAK